MNKVESCAIIKREREERMAQRRRISSEVKAEAALEAIRGQMSINEIASKYEVHPNQVTAWKKEVLDRMPEILSDRRSKKQEGKNGNEGDLYQQIGHLTMQVEYLKKKSGLFR